MLKKLYKKSPLVVQNILISIENIAVLYKKYGYIPLLNPMSKIAKKISKSVVPNSPESLVERLNLFLDDITDHSPYYMDKKELYSGLDRLDDISKLPLLSKKVLKSQTDQFYSSLITKANSRTLHTSGSTGSPMKIKVSVQDLQSRFHLLLKTMMDFGYDPSKPLGRITGHDISDERVIYRKDYINQHYFFSAFHISPDSVQKYLDAIVTHKIEALEGYPSAIYLLAKLFEERGYKIECVKHVFTTAEKLHDYQRDQIQKVFGCKVFDYYGSNEQSIFIFTCTQGRLHTADTTGLLEVLDGDGDGASVGSEGRMVVTSLTSHFMPLVRYEIGDLCVVSEDQSCSCGSGGLILDEIIGRDEDIFQTVDGNYITRFSVVLKCLPTEVFESQLILNNQKLEVVLNYLSTDIIKIDKFSSFRQALEAKIGTKYKLEVRKVEKLVATSRGKKKAVIIEN